MTIVRAMPAHCTILTHVGEKKPSSFCTRSFSRLSRVGFFSILMWTFPALSRSKSTWVWSTTSRAARRATVPAVTTSYLSSRGSAIRAVSASRFCGSSARRSSAWRARSPSETEAARPASASAGKSWRKARSSSGVHSVSATPPARSRTLANVVNTRTAWESSSPRIMSSITGVVLEPIGRICPTEVSRGRRGFRFPRFRDRSWPGLFPQSLKIGPGDRLMVFITILHPDRQRLVVPPLRTREVALLPGDHPQLVIGARRAVLVPLLFLDRQRLAVPLLRTREVALFLGDRPQLVISHRFSFRVAIVFARRREQLEQAGRFLKV